MSQAGFTFDSMILILSESVGWTPFKLHLYDPVFSTSSAISDHPEVPSGSTQDIGKYFVVSIEPVS